MMTSWNGNIFHVTGHMCGEFTGPPVNSPPQRPVMRSFDVFFDLRLIKRLRKQSWGWWFEMLSRPLWRYCNDWNDITYSGAWDYHNQIVDSYTTLLSVSSLSIGLCTAVCPIQYRETMWSRFMWPLVICTINKSPLTFFVYSNNVTCFMCNILNAICIWCWPNVPFAIWCLLWVFFFNSLAPGRSYCDFKKKSSILLYLLVFKSSYNNVLRWMPQDLTDVKSTLVWVMA